MNVYSRIVLTGSLVFSTGILGGASGSSPINGIVTNKSGAAIRHALAVLTKAGIYTYTDQNGGFDFKNANKIPIGIQSPASKPVEAYAVSLHRRTLFFKINAPQTVSLSVYDLKGRKTVDLIHSKGFSAGAHAIPLTYGQAGIYILKCTVGAHSFALKYSPLFRSNSRPDIATRTEGNPMTRVAASGGTDVLRVSAPGYAMQSRTVSDGTQGVTLALDTLSNKIGNFALVDGLYDRIKINGKESYFWGMIGGKEVPASKIITANDSQVVDIVVLLNPRFVDNTYGNNRIGWNHHSFRDLEKSDHVELTCNNGDSVPVFRAKIDYISGAGSASSGYACLGITGGDGLLIQGSASGVVSYGSTLDDNFNYYKYVLLADSPKTDSLYKPDPQYPYWNFAVGYHITLWTGSFGARGFKNATIGWIHASPSKTGDDTVPVILKVKPPVITDPFIKIPIIKLPDID